jgi:hypothetical protein
VNLSDGKEHTLKFLAEEEFVSKFNNKKGIRYSVLEDGAEKMLETTSIRLRKELASYELNDTLKIKRVGDRFDTEYIVKKANGDNKETTSEPEHIADMADPDSF